jgi:hypothetical protein
MLDFDVGCFLAGLGIAGGGGVSIYIKKTNPSTLGRASRSDQKSERKTERGWARVQSATRNLTRKQSTPPGTPTRLLPHSADELLHQHRAAGRNCAAGVQTREHKVAMGGEWRMPGEGRRWDAAALLGQVESRCTDAAKVEQDIIACICLFEKMRVGQLKN